MGSRRSFLKQSLAALGAGGVLLTGGWAQAKKVAMKLDKVPALKKVGGSARVKISDREILLIRDGENSIRALSPKCTHSECYVKYSHKEQKIKCGCHGSYFDLSGKVLNGPANKPLPGYPASLDKDRIILTLD